MGAARSMWDEAKHPRGAHGFFGASGEINRKKYPHAVSSSGRIGFEVTRKKVTLKEFGPIHYMEGPWFHKRGRARTPVPSRFGKKSTTTFNVKAGQRTASGGIQVVTLPRLKRYWGKASRK